MAGHLGHVMMLFLYPRIAACLIHSVLRVPHAGI